MIKTHRPAEVKILAILIAVLGFWNAIRFIQGLISWHILTEYQAQYGPLYSTISGAAWAVIGTLLLRPLWKGKPWAWRATFGALAAFLLWLIFDRFLLQQAHGNEFFTWIAITILVIFLILLLFSRNLRDYYHA